MTNILSLAAGLGVISIIFMIAGVNPLFAISEIFQGSFGSVYGFKETVTKAIPLILIGSGLTLAFRAKFWNIGAEGQLLMGAIFATWTGLTFGDTLPSWRCHPDFFGTARRHCGHRQRHPVDLSDHGRLFSEP
jgi:simple sugar transport system permease protein